MVAECWCVASPSGQSCLYLEGQQVAKEFGSILGFSHNHGAWEIEEGRIHCLSDGHAEAMTGNYFTRDCRVEGSLLPVNGGSHLVSIHVQGAQRGYYGGLAVGGKAVLMKNCDGRAEVLAFCDFDWRLDREYKVAIEHSGGKLSLSIDGQQLFSLDETDYTFGMAGYAIFGQGRCYFGDLTLSEKVGNTHDQPIGIVEQARNFRDRAWGAHRTGDWRLLWRRARNQPNQQLWLHGRLQQGASWSPMTRSLPCLRPDVD